MRNLTALSKMNGRVYVKLSDSICEQKFMDDAKHEGFTFSNGDSISERHAENIMAVNHDRTINYVGAAGRMAFGSKANTINGEKMIRVDYDKYISGDSDYLLD